MSEAATARLPEPKYCASCGKSLEDGHETCHVCGIPPLLELRHQRKEAGQTRMLPTRIIPCAITTKVVRILFDLAAELAAIREYDKTFRTVCRIKDWVADHCRCKNHSRC
jgi:hypothetical protein